MNESHEPENNSILSLQAVALPNNRVRAVVDISADHGKPNLEFRLMDDAGEEITSAVILETIASHVEFTLHIRNSFVTLPLTLVCSTFFEKGNILDSKSIPVPSQA